MAVNYCEPNDIIDRLKQTAYDHLVDDNGDGTDDTDEVAANVTAAIEAASETMAEYFSNRSPPYDVNAIPPGGERWCKFCCVDLAVWQMAGNGGGEIPDAFQIAYDSRISRLEKIEAGNVIPGTSIETDFDDEYKGPFEIVTEYTT